MKLRPTHRCYDDALDLITHWMIAEPEIAREPEVWLAHGICTDSDEGHLYAHAWVERKNLVYNGAINEKSGERVYVEIPREYFHKVFGVTDVNYYSIRRAVAENTKHGHFGPWTESHMKLTGPRGSLVKDAEGKVG